MATPVPAEAASVSPALILALVPDARGGRGGMAECMRSAIAALAGMDDSTEIIVLSRHGGGTDRNVPESVIWKRIAQHGKAGFATAMFQQMLSGRKPDLIFCGHLNLVPMARLTAKRFGSPLLVYLHGIEAWSPPPRSLVRRHAPLADGYIAVSGLTRNRFSEWSGVDMSRISVLPNAVHIERFGSAPRSPRLVRRYGLEGKRVLMTLCRLDSRQRHKGVDEVIEILPNLLERHDDLVFLVAGEGDDRQRLEEKASRHGVADKVVFTGWIEESEKADHLRLADAFTLAGHGDGFGIVLLEAMACGIPVIASSLDGTSETVLGGKLGQVANPENRESLINAILRAFDTPKAVPAELSEFSYQAYSRRLASVVLRLIRMQVPER